MSLTEKVRGLRRQAVELERQAVEQDRHDSHLAALQRERAFAVQQVAHGRALDERRETLQGGGPLLTSEKTGNEIAAEWERAVELIDAEIARVSA